MNSLSKLLAFPKTNSTGSQTELSDNGIEFDPLKTRESHKTDADVEISGEAELCKSDCSESCDVSCTELEYLEGDESALKSKMRTVFSCPAKILLRINLN